MIDVEVLQLALLKEEEAIEIYQKMMLEHPNLEDILFHLVTEEQKHKVLLEKKIEELTAY